jgi:MerR family transcriptional regulator, light-induced transcriptional regulator
MKGVQGLSSLDRPCTSTHMPPGLFHIGEVSRRTGLSADVIRVWERRYGLVKPVRSDGNFRLYSQADVAQLELMRHYLRQQVPPARAAELVLRAQRDAPDANPGVPAREAASARSILRDSLERFDEAPAERLLRRLLTMFAPGTVVRDVVVPYLRELGERWACGEASVAQEHFASCFLEGWMMGIARAPAAPGRRRAVLACVPEERHALGLLAFGIALRDFGWRLTYLGGDIPLEAVSDAADAVSADAVVLATVSPDALAAAADDAAALAERHPVAVGGAGTAAPPPALAPHVLPEDIVEAALRLSIDPPGPPRPQ